MDNLQKNSCYYHYDDVVSMIQQSALVSGPFTAHII